MYPLCSRTYFVSDFIYSIIIYIVYIIYIILYIYSIISGIISDVNVYICACVQNFTIS